MQSENKAAATPEPPESFREIVEWLVAIEARAAGLYGRLSEAFAGDAELKELLTELGRDEDEHHAVLKCVFERIGQTGFTPLIRIGGEAKKETEEKFRGLEEGLAKGLTEDDALDFIVDIEFSEFNSLFLYAAAALDRSEFVPAVIHIRRHKKRVENFLRSRGLMARLEKIKKLPELWREKILIIDDEDMINHAIQSVFENECLVANARNGADALKMVGETYYSVIITDIALPVMSGIEFYKRASAIFPSIRERIIFFTGIADEKILSFLNENNLSYIIKPVGIREIKKAVMDVLSR
jgi:CheY-like chemotaxis protein